jgi:hypothetical protein
MYDITAAQISVVCGRNRRQSRWRSNREHSVSRGKYTRIPAVEAHTNTASAARKRVGGHRTSQHLDLVYAHHVVPHATPTTPFHIYPMHSPLADRRRTEDVPSRNDAMTIWHDRARTPVHTT